MNLSLKSVFVASLSALALVLAAPAGAQTSDSLDVTPASATAGATITVAGDGCVAGAQVELRFDGDLVGDTEAAADGSFTGTIDVPDGLAAARYEVSAMCATAEDASTFFTGNVGVELPRTGSASGPLAAIGLGLAALGAGLVLLTSLRRRLASLA